MDIQMLWKRGSRYSLSQTIDRFLRMSGKRREIVMVKGINKENSFTKFLVCSLSLTSDIGRNIYYYYLLLLLFIIIIIIIIIYSFISQK